MPEPSAVQTRVVQLMIFHRRVMQHNYGRLSGAANRLSAIQHPGSEAPHGESGFAASPPSSLSQANAVNNIQARWCAGEDAELFRERWEKLFSEFCDGDKVDPSKISELYDTMKFDALHNRHFLEWVFTPPKSMLEEEYGHGGRDSKDGEDNAKTSEDSRSERSHRGALAEMIEDSEANKAAKRSFKRRSWRTLLRHRGNAAPPEQYFRIHRGDHKTKAMTDARLEPLRELYQLAKVLFDFICPQEYGISDQEKVRLFPPPARLMDR
jgi:hypothetical protein